LNIVYCDACKKKFDGHTEIPVVRLTIKGVAFDFCADCLEKMAKWVITLFNPPKPVGAPKPPLLAPKKAAKKKAAKKKAAKRGLN